MIGRLHTMPKSIQSLLRGYMFVAAYRSSIGDVWCSRNQDAILTVTPLWIAGREGHYQKYVGYGVVLYFADTGLKASPAFPVLLPALACIAEYFLQFSRPVECGTHGWRGMVAHAIEKRTTICSSENVAPQHCIIKYLCCIHTIILHFRIRGRSICRNEFKNPAVLGGFWSTERRKVCICPRPVAGDHCRRLHCSPLTDGPGGSPPRRQREG